MSRVAFFLLLGALLAPSAARAQSCSFSVTDLNFGNVDTLTGGAVDVSGTVNVSCRSGLLSNVRVCVNIEAGSGGATSGTRHARNGTGDALDYNLFQDPARTIPWGSHQQPALGTPVAMDFLQILFPSQRSSTIYGRVFPGQQHLPAGIYSSTFSGGQVSISYARYGLFSPPPSCAAIGNRNVTTSSFTVMANIADNCRVSAQDLNFGSHGLLDSAVDATGGIDVTCTPGTDYQVALNNGQNGNAPVDRRMVLGGETVTYGLYRDAARTQPWGDIVGVNTQAGTGAGSAQNLPVYGRVPAQATPSPGTYRDTVVVTVTY